jgi:hypothetical protein
LIPSGWIPARQLEEFALSLDVKPRRLAGWRERDLVSHPTRFGHEGKKPVWAYPPGTDQRLRSVVRWRRTTRDLKSIKVGVWADGFDVPVEEVRSSMLRVLEAFERSQSEELRRFADPPAGTDVRHDPAQLGPALDAFANEAARKRGDFPVPRRVEMKLEERTRGMRYALDLAFGQEPDPEDAIHLERVLGISRGRSGTARGGIPWQPNDGFAPFNVAMLIEQVTEADTKLFEAAQASLKTLLHFLRFLYPVLLPADSSLQGFVQNADATFEDASAYEVAMLGAVFISNMAKQNAEPAQIEEYTRLMRPEDLIKEFGAEMSAEERAALANRLKEHIDNN